MNDLTMPLMIPLLATAYVLVIHLILRCAQRYAAASHSASQKAQ